MSDGVIVTGGGAVQVDTASLDRVAGGLDRIVDDLSVLADRARIVRRGLDDIAGPSGGAGLDAAWSACSSFDTVGERARDLAGSLREASGVYTIVELTTERSLALAAGDQGRADAAAAQLAAARAADPGAAAKADFAALAWRLQWAGRTSDDVTSALGWLLPVTAGLSGVVLPAAIGSAGTGLVPRGAAPTGSTPQVTVRPVGTPGAPTTPPTSLAAACSRIPTGAPDDDDLDGDARIRVEASTMPDGSTEYTVYLAGTQEWGLGTDEPFDITSDAQLYTGHDAASLEAARAALVAAGAQPADPVTVVGFSQGAMVGAYLAQDPTYDVRALIAAGSPVVTDLPADVLSVSLVHADDPVAALQGPIMAAPTGSADSIVITRTADPADGPGDIVVPAHRQQAYVDTARLFEASGDPRAAEVDALFDHLSTATSTVATEYSATIR